MFFTPGMDILLLVIFIGVVWMFKPAIWNRFLLARSRYRKKRAIAARMAEEARRQD